MLTEDIPGARPRYVEQEARRAASNQNRKLKNQAKIEARLRHQVNRNS